MKLSIVIPNWLTEQGGKIAKTAEAFWFLTHCVERIKKYTDDYELILIDNGSVLGQEFMDREADKYIRNEENLGFAKACNQGFAAAEGEYIVCVNNDIFVWPGWVDALYQTFKDNLNCGLAMPALMKQTKDARVALEIEDPDMPNKGEYGPGAEFGSCWMAKKELLDRLKGEDGYIFDERFKMGFSEDRDLYRRVRMLGLETIRTHNTRVFHQGNVSVCKLENRRQYTLPNRIYFGKLKETERADNKLTENEKDTLRREAEEEYQEGLKNNE